MITKIQKIQQFRGFQDYTWPANLHHFKKYNIIYGWNGSGKTTLSNLLRQIEKKTCYPDCEDFEIQTSLGKIRSNNLNESSLMIKVYNQDFRDENISFKTGDAHPIFFIGQDSIDKQKEIEKRRREISNKTVQLTSFKDDLKGKEKTLDQLCIDQAGMIKEILHAEGDCEYNHYHKGDFRKKSELLKNIDYKQKIVGKKEFLELKVIISSDNKPVLHKINLDFHQFENVKTQINKILKESLISETIERLARNDRLNSWVKEGLEIVKRGNFQNCPFCEQKLPKGLMKKLESHFNDQYSDLIHTIDELDHIVQHLIEDAEILLPKPIEFYPEFLGEYETYEKEIKAALMDYSRHLYYLSQKLSEKRKNPFKKMQIEEEMSTQKLQSDFNAINRLIDKHNDKTEHFNETIFATRHQIEEHLVAKKMNEYTQIKTEISSKYQMIDKLSKEIEGIKTIIETIETDLIEHRKPAKEINADLKRYLGHSEIKFAIKDTGYQITRDGNPAQNLSEGEKTAITFIYFLKTLQENNFKLEKGIVVVDDPISSLDSNSLYYAFQFMKNRTKNSAQLIVLTHNYSFFKEVKNWYSHIDWHKKRDNEKKCGYYMLQNSFLGGRRTSLLEDLDELLKDYDSEYHYLFSLVYKNSISDTETLKKYYLFPNISRRLLELFLAFRVPSKMTLSARIKEIQFDPVRKDRIYRFVNDNSHSGHISGESDRDLSYLAETQQISRDIIDLIKDTDGAHFDEMLKIVAPIQNTTVL